jgi:hypothetical protein
MSDPTNSPDTPSAIFSLGSADGPTPWPLPDGRLIDPCGLAHALASLSASQVRALGLQISGISGLHGSISSHSAVLQSSLESRLRTRLGTAGSMELSLTWKAKATPAGRPYCQRVPQMHRIDVTGYGSLPTPSGTSNHGKNHVSGRIDEWGGSSNYFRGKEGGNEHLPGFELWTMGYPAAWRELMPPATRSSRKSPQPSSKATAKPEA